MNKFYPHIFCNNEEINITDICSSCISCNKKLYNKEAHLCYFSVDTNITYGSAFTYHSDNFLLCGRCLKPIDNYIHLFIDQKVLSCNTFITTHSGCCSTCHNNSEIGNTWFFVEIQLTCKLLDVKIDGDDIFESEMIICPSCYKNKLVE